MDRSPRTVFAMLLDAGRYLGSVSTFYRVLRAAGETRGRRDQLTHPAYAKPELLATAPRQLWSWDITKLKGPAKWVCFHLYVILDVFSRYVVGWMLALRESAELAQELIAATCEKERILPGALTLHADRGSSMRSKPVAMLLVDLDVAKSHMSTMRHGPHAERCSFSGRIAHSPLSPLRASRLLRRRPPEGPEGAASRRGQVRAARPAAKAV
jgi:transposase InsO family protein